ncbi:influenza virus NS1A-binding protein homolog A-like [Stylophora pistillata]|nr:influenza virus NS1A-binding protein homolog A-like [Stylophora pistillata]
MLTFRDQLYTFQEFSKAEKFDPVFNGWSKSDLTDVSVDNAIVTVVKGDMYAIEVNKPVGQSTIKRYNVELCTWQTVVESPQGCRNDSCVVAVGSYLYLMGGSAPGDAQYVTKAERFNTVEKQWEEIADMQQGRGGAFGEVSGGKIFVAGGVNQEGKVSERCEMYNVSTNEWQYIGSLNHGRVYGSMVCLKETLYVLGGSESSLRAVESYDSTKDKWIETTAIPMTSFPDETENTFTCCVLKIFKGVVDKAELFPNLTGFSVSVTQSQSAFGTGLFGSGSPGFGTRPFGSASPSQSGLCFGSGSPDFGIRPFGSASPSQSGLCFGVPRSQPVSNRPAGFTFGTPRS